MVYTGSSALVGQSICLCPSICLLSLIDCLFLTLPSIQVRQLIVYPCVYQFRPSVTRPLVTFIAPSFAPSPPTCPSYVLSPSSSSSLSSFLSHFVFSCPFCFFAVFYHLSVCRILSLCPPMCTYITSYTSEVRPGI